MAINREKIQAAATKLLQGGRHDKAILEFRKLVEDDPRDVRTLLKIGDIHVKIGQRAQAIEAYGEVANVYREQGFQLKAVAVYKQMLRVDGTLPQVHLELAELYQQMGLASDSLQHYQQVAAAYEQQGRVRESLQMLKRMVDLDPENLPSKIKLAELFAQQQMMPQALEEFRSAATYLLQAGRHDEFIRVAERLLYFQPGADDITHSLSRIYLQRGDAKAALSKLQVCFKADGRNLVTLELIAQAFLDMQQVAKSVSVYKEMARIHQATGRNDDAQASWQRVLALAPGDPDALAGVRGPVSAPSAGGVHLATPGPGAAPSAPGASAPAAAPQAVAQTVAPAAGPAPARASAANPSAHDEQVKRLVNETTVFLKYKLYAKALDALQKALALQPDHLEAHALKLDVHRLMGDDAAAQEELRVLVQLASVAGDARASAWRREFEGAAAARHLDADEDEIVLLEEEEVEEERIQAPAASVPRWAQPERAPEPSLPRDGAIDALASDEANDAALADVDEDLSEEMERAAALAEDDLLGIDAFDDDLVEVDDDPSGEGLSIEEADALVAEALASLSEPLPLEEADAAPSDPSPEPAATTPSEGGKLGLGAHAAGFEEDLAMDFFADELEEAEFFIQQDILDAAREIIEFILDDIPDSPRARWMLARIEAREAGASEPPAPWEQRIIEEVAQELGDQAANAPVASDEQQISVEEVLDQFRRGVAQTVDEDDAETHYNLGIAYREMGLLQDAVAEFQLSTRSLSTAADSHHLIGLTLMDLGKPADALGAFEASMSVVGASAKQQGANHYQRGVCFETMGRPADAAQAYELATALGTEVPDLPLRLQRARASR